MIADKNRFEVYLNINIYKIWCFFIYKYIENKKNKKNRDNAVFCKRKKNFYCKSIWNGFVALKMVFLTKNCMQIIIFYLTQFTLVRIRQFCSSAIVVGLWTVKPGAPFECRSGMTSSEMRAIFWCSFDNLMLRMLSLISAFWLGRAEYTRNAYETIASRTERDRIIILLWRSSSKSTR
jgi:hypothetical protein